MSTFSIEETGIQDCFIIRSAVLQDERGYFREWYKEIPNFHFVTRQANVSQSGIGVLRGLHYSVGPAAQAKVVSCMSGEFQDVLLDVRSTSPTFRKTFAIRAAANSGVSIYVAPGVAHGFLSLKQDTQVAYLTSEPYDPSAERSVNAFDPLIRDVWLIQDVKRSPKDVAAPFLSSNQ